MKTHYERRGPTVAFDDTLPEGVDPDANWRKANGTGFRRTGSTANERAGKVAGYTPGYGRSSGQNRYGASSLTPSRAWDDQFEPKLGDQMGQTPSQMGTMPPGATPPPAVPTVLPPAANPPALPVLPPSPGATGATPSGPAIQQIDGTNGEATVRRVTGLPTGQTAFASFSQGQNAPDKLNAPSWRRNPATGGNMQTVRGQKRPPVDPLSS